MAHNLSFDFEEERRGITARMKAAMESIIDKYQNVGEEEGDFFTMDDLQICEDKGQLKHQEVAHFGFLQAAACSANDDDDDDDDREPDNDDELEDDDEQPSAVKMLRDFGSRMEHSICSKMICEEGEDGKIRWILQDDVEEDILTTIGDSDSDRGDISGEDEWAESDEEEDAERRSPVEHDEQSLEDSRSSAGTAESEEELKSEKHRKKTERKHRRQDDIDLLEEPDQQSEMGNVTPVHHRSFSKAENADKDVSRRKCLSVPAKRKTVALTSKCHQEDQQRQETSEESLEEPAFSRPSSSLVGDMPSHPKGPAIQTSTPRRDADRPRFSTPKGRKIPQNDEVPSPCTLVWDQLDNIKLGSPIQNGVSPKQEVLNDQSSEEMEVNESPKRSTDWAKQSVSREQRKSAGASRILRVNNIKQVGGQRQDTRQWDQRHSGFSSDSETETTSSTQVSSPEAGRRRVTRWSQSSSEIDTVDRKMVRGQMSQDIKVKKVTKRQGQSTTVGKSAGSAVNQKKRSGWRRIVSSSDEQEDRGTPRKILSSQCMTYNQGKERLTGKVRRNQRSPEMDIENREVRRSQRSANTVGKSPCHNPGVRQKEQPDRRAEWKRTPSKSGRSTRHVARSPTYDMR
ncbi:Hypp2685 [Branchiostoma lanceolatum]|uniref:Hypp2685 protein n=1 Tax=Branchiostoma lanceolatum TaxID=7740 RepID=A0A8K0ERI5_BRALA|nr:Hypp2685 [Branchiostoma lanceolatum]